MENTIEHDLHATRARIRQGHTDANREVERCIAAAQSARSKNVYRETCFADARTAAADPRTQTTPLAGLAVSIKDLFDVEGQVTCAGSTVLADRPPAVADCVAVQRLRSAGAAIIGRTNMVEFAYSAIGNNPHYGTPANGASSAVALIPGGSSSGAAVSVATGSAFVGLGSDTGGSIRILPRSTESSVSKALPGWFPPPEPCLCPPHWIRWGPSHFPCVTPWPCMKFSAPLR